MTARLTPAEAKALGLDVKATKTRTTRKTAPGPYRTRCDTCGETFTTRAGEDRHVNEARHWRYALVLEDAVHGRPGNVV